MGWGGGGGSDYSYDTKPTVVQKSAVDYRKDEGDKLYYGGGRGIPAPSGRTITTESPTPLVVAVDVTGSMDKWPEKIFNSLARIYNEIKLSLPDVEISFAAIGDAYCDSYPLQICDFKKGKALDDEIRKIYAEGGGGGTGHETYELAAKYYAHFCNMPNAKKGIFIFCGDEAFYENISRNHMKDLLGITDSTLSAYDAFSELRSKFDVYLLNVPTDCYAGRISHEELLEPWIKAIGKENILKMENPQRINSNIIGIASMVSGNSEIFEDRLKATQPEDHVKEVLETLHPLRNK